MCANCITAISWRLFYVLLLFEYILFNLKFVSIVYKAF